MSRLFCALRHSSWQLLPDSEPNLNLNPGEPSVSVGSHKPRFADLHFFILASRCLTLNPTFSGVGVLWCIYMCSAPHLA